MKMVKCKKCGSIYNKSKYEKCPKCDYDPNKRIKESGTIFLSDEINSGRIEKTDEKEISVLNNAEVEEKSESVPVNIRTAYLSLDPNNGEKITIDKNIFKIGRHSSSDLILNDSKISRNHASIIKEKTKFRLDENDTIFYLKDENSLNSTYLNGNKLIPSQKYKLSNKDQITFNKTIYHFIEAVIEVEEDIKE